MGDRFVTETELEEAKRRRQEEWERVRKPEDPKEAPEAPVDNRSLYERLKEQKDKKEAADADAKAFKNLVKGLDSEETDFLDLVDNLKAKEARRLKNEEEELFAQMKQGAPASPPKLEEVLGAPGPSNKAAKPKANKQAQLLSSVVKRKSGGSEEEPPSKRNSESASDIDSRSSTAAVCIGVRPTAMKVVGTLPGIGDYASSDEEADTDSSSASSDNAVETKTYPLNMPQNQPESASGQQPADKEKAIQRQNSSKSEK